LSHNVETLCTCTRERKKAKKK